MRKPLRVGILASGNGTNAQALMDACAVGTLSARIVLLGCNRSRAGVLARAQSAGVPVCLADASTTRDRSARQALLRDALLQAQAQLIVLAGFDEILLPEFVAAFENRIINTHPSLLPSFAGSMHAVQQALDYGVKVTGCTVHLVTNDLDAGPILFQHCVPVHEDDTADTLHQRIRQEEYSLLPRAVQAFADDLVVNDGTRIRVLAPAPRG